MIEYQKLFNPVWLALKDLGGSGTAKEISDKVCEILKLSDKEINLLHGDTNQREIDYRLAWARTYLKNYGLLENSGRGVWAIVADKRDIEKIDEDAVMAAMKKITSERKEEKKKTPYSSAFSKLDDDDIDAPEEVQTRKEELLQIVANMEPAAFERLTQRMLREAGFSQVEVTGRTGDGGIDGKGVYKIGGLVGFTVMFQCKRYKGSVSSNQIRDFRGAIQGRADKGLFVTTGTFTRDAMKEAVRDGGLNIDLLDGRQLVENLKELGLGVKVEIIESVKIDKNWYENI